MFYDGNMCMDCHMSCMTCEGPEETNCLSCDESANRMVDSTGACGCLNGHFETATSPICEHCDLNCLECSGPSDMECILCDDTRELINGSCVCLP